MQERLIAILLGTSLAFHAHLAIAGHVSGSLSAWPSFGFARPALPVIHNAPHAMLGINRFGSFRRSHHNGHFHRSQRAFIAGICCFNSGEIDNPTVVEAPADELTPPPPSHTAPRYVRPSIETTPEGVTIVRGAPPEK